MICFFCIAAREDDIIMDARVPCCEYASIFCHFGKQYKQYIGNVYCEMWLPFY